MGAFEPSEWAKKDEEYLTLAGSLWGGTPAMREKAETYLPKERLEKKQAYTIRLKNTTLYNMFKRSILADADKVCRKRVTLEDDESFIEFAENVDRQGRTLHQFAYSVAKHAIKDGLRFIYVDAPRAENVETLADEVGANIRPYFVEIDRRNILGFKHVDGVITQVRILEEVEEEVDEFTSKTEEQVRVVEPGYVRIYRKDDKGKEYIFDEFATSMDIVTVVPVYASQTGLLESDFPKLDLAWLNVDHWRKSSDYSNILHVACVPIRVIAGFPQETDESGKKQPFDIGINSNAISPDPQASIKYAEISGSGAISAGRDDLKDIEERAQALAGEFSAKKPGNITATEKAIDSAETNSGLQNFAMNLKGSLETAFDYAAMMVNSEFRGSVSIDADFSIVGENLTPDGISKLVLSGVLDKKTALNILNQIENLDLDVDMVIEAIENETPIVDSFGEDSAG